MAQTCGKDRIRVVIAAREPVRFRKQEIDTDNPGRCRDVNQPGELIARPGPLSEMTN